MSGNTGKMTREAIAARGPRLVLARVTGSPVLVIFREGDDPFKSPAGRSVLARSYSRSYLLRVAEGNR